VGTHYPYQCFWTESFYLRSAAWSPDDSRIYTAETGFHPWNLPVRHHPRTGLCDASAAWPAVHKPVRDIWISYTGCDSLSSVAADSRAVHVAGHPRWANNPSGCDFRSRGAVADEGLQGLSPRNGLVLRNSSGRAGRYSMSPAHADTMLITKAGLWIGSTNRFRSNLCGGGRRSRWDLLPALSPAARLGSLAQRAGCPARARAGAQCDSGHRGRALSSWPPSASANCSSSCRSGPAPLVASGCSSTPGGGTGSEYQGGGSP
jgi:hypothetical protein